jgi:ankyrin repeat protein
MKENLSLLCKVVVVVFVAILSANCNKRFQPGGPNLSLHDAAIHYPERIQELIGKGHVVNNTDHMFGTPLMAAVRFGRTESVKILLAHGANPNIPDKLGHLPLPFAAYHEHMKEIVELLVKRNADINAKGYYGRSALHYAAIHGDAAQASFLLDKGADLDIRGDVFGFTPLLCAVNAQKTEMVSFLLQKGASVEVTNDSGLTALAIARHKDPNIVRLLKHYMDN